MKYRMIVFEDDTAMIQKHYRFWPFWVVLDIQGEVVDEMRDLFEWRGENKRYLSIDAARTALSMWLDQEDEKATSKRRVRTVPVDIYLSSDLDQINEAFG